MPSFCTEHAHRAVHCPRGAKEHPCVFDKQARAVRTKSDQGDFCTQRYLSAVWTSTRRHRVQPHQASSGVLLRYKTLVGLLDTILCSSVCLQHSTIELQMRDREKRARERARRRVSAVTLLVVRFRPEWPCGRNRCPELPWRNLTVNITRSVGGTEVRCGLFL